MSTTTTPITRELELGNHKYVIERPTGLKASRALAILRELSRSTPELQTSLADFRRTYEEENVVKLDRVQAKLRYPPRPLYDDDGKARLDDDGLPILVPSPVDRLTDEDWANAGGFFRLAASPSGTEVAMALLDRSLELAEDTVYRFLALFTIANDDLKRARKDGDDSALIAERAAELLDDAFADELVELAVVVSETVDQHFRRKASDLGGRLGKALRTFGVDWTPTTPESAPESSSSPSSSKPTSSTASDSTTGGTPTSPSDSPTTSSSPSDASPQPTPTPESNAS
jgi:hypothetical protein